MRLVPKSQHPNIPGGTFEDLCEEQALNAESEVIEIYAQESVSLEARLGFFPIEEMEGRIEFQSKGVRITISSTSATSWR